MPGGSESTGSDGVNSIAQVLQNNQVQWGLEYQMCSVLEWLNGLGFWNGAQISKGSKNKMAAGS